MAEYIELETAVKAFNNFDAGRADSPPFTLLTPEEFAEYLYELPAADVAPVVRCENCAFSQSDGWVCGGTALMPQHRTFPNSFCSDGERKDGGQCE